MRVLKLAVLLVLKLVELKAGPMAYVLVELMVSKVVLKLVELLVSKLVVWKAASMARMMVELMV